MTIFFQLTNSYSDIAKNDSITYTTNPSNNNSLIIRRIRNNNNNNQQKQDPLKNFAPGVKEKEEVFDNKKVKITTTTTIEKDNDNTIITVVEESKYHKTTKKITIQPDGSQKIQSEGKNKVKTCKMPSGFAQKYLSSSCSLAQIK